MLVVLGLLVCACSTGAVLVCACSTGAVLVCAACTGAVLVCAVLFCWTGLNHGCCVDRT